MLERKKNKVVEYVVRNESKKVLFTKPFGAENNFMAKHRIQDIIMILPNFVWIKVTFLYDENNYNKFFNFDLFVLTDLFYLLGKMNTT